MAAGTEHAYAGTFHIVTPRCPEQVWTALTSPQATARYLHGLHLRSCWRPGAPLHLDGATSRLHGEVLWVCPPGRLSYTIDDDSGTSTYLTWTVRPGAGGAVVRLDVVESGAGGHAEDSEDAWLGVLEQLRDVLSQPAADRG